MIMTEPRAVSIDEVRSLVAERQRYEDWLTALEARRDETPIRVFERVHADYIGRRAGVLDQLRGHIGALSTLEQDLEGRLGDLETRLAALEDERAEAMLRTAVGEFDGARWEAVRLEVEATIAQHGETQAGLRHEADEIRGLLASASAAPDVSAEPDHLAPVDAHLTGGAASDDVGVLGVEEAETLADHGSDAAEGGYLEIAVEMPMLPVEATESVSEPVLHAVPELDSPFDVDIPVTGHRSHYDAEIHLLHVLPPESALPTLPTAAELGELDDALAMFSDNTGDADDPFDDLAFLRSVTEGDSAVLPMPSSITRPADVPGGADAHRASAPALKSSEQLKTLRCTECNTMNLPTEWYCERCGGELAAF